MRVGEYQIKIAPDGPWHRPGADGTACGQKMTGAFMSRDASLEGTLCPECFTPHEIETGKMRRIERAALDAAEAESHDFEDATPTDLIDE